MKRMVVFVAMVLSLALVACGGTAAPAVTPERVEVPVEVTRVVEGTAQSEPARVTAEPATASGGDTGSAEEVPMAEATAAPMMEAEEGSDASAPAGGAAADMAPLPTAPMGGTTGEAMPPAVDRTAQYEAVTAGVVDDNERWGEYLGYLSGYTGPSVLRVDVAERYDLLVTDNNQQSVHDATVRIFDGQQLVWEARTDTGGRVRFFPGAVAGGTGAARFTVAVQKGNTVQEAAFERTGSGQWSVSLVAPVTPPRAQLDVLFLMDATGSMDDEIAKLKASMADIADQIAQLPGQPDVRYALVSYRDQGEPYVVRTGTFTTDLAAFQASLNELQAAGGGDTPEALNEALYRSIHELDWRTEDTVRLAFLVADAPPHLDYQEPYRYDRDMATALQRGIKLFPIGASGLDEQGQYIFRQLAQFTGGKFVFLTYAQAGAPGSGPGVETDMDVANYSVDTLDSLVVRLITDELAQLPQVGGQ